jgi:shikimate dehydrogenase
VIKAFVAGWPVSHSLSPSLHGFWLRRYHIEGSYEAVPIEPERFQYFLKALPASGFAGGNVTIPHKEAAFAACDRLDAEARAIGAVNTVWHENGRVCGTCTDAYGFSANLDQHQPDWRGFGNALVMGAGGASRAIVHALLSAGSGKVSIVNRTFERARAVAEAFGTRVSPYPWDMISRLLPGADLIVNTTPLGMEGHEADEFDILPAKDNAMVTDIVYVPLETPLLRAARMRGLKTVDGIGMLLHQAVPGFEKWFGVRPEVDQDLRLHLLSVLSARAARGT